MKNVIASRRGLFSAMWEAIGMGLAAIRAYKLRAGLTILGVVMGIMTVTGMSSIVAGLNKSMASQIQNLGSSVVFVRPWGPGENLTGEERRRRRGLSENEVKAILEHCPSVKEISPMEILRYDTIKTGNARVESATLLGTVEAFSTVHDLYVEKGRFLSTADVNRGTRVAVIGHDVAESLYGPREPVDKEMMVDGMRFRVIGVLERRGKFLGMNRDNDILVPLGSTGKRDPFFNFMVADLKPVSPDKMDDAAEEVRSILRRQRKLKFLVKDNFMIFTQDTLTNLYNQITGGIYMVMIAISSIGLVVGGVGVMNIMLVSVTERTREIGVRKALGATRRDILAQFLTEAMTLTGVGGVLGIVIGGGLAMLVNTFSPFPAVMQPTWVVIAFVVAILTGVFFGMWPAAKAARLDPIEALRYE
jgi:putative ABC transport system permease protein